MLILMLCVRNTNATEGNAEILLQYNKWPCGWI